MKKVDGGILGHWKIHAVPNAKISELMPAVYPDAIRNPALILTGFNLQNPDYGKWRRTSWLVKVDLEQGIIETLNTTYRIDLSDKSDEPDIGPQLAAGAMYEQIYSAYILNGEKIGSPWPGKRKNLVQHG